MFSFSLHTKCSMFLCLCSVIMTNLKYVLHIVKGCLNALELIVS
jgi:hypothetical protein